jgi:drug/metabolite transporter (DMT)-like permease
MTQQSGTLATTAQRPAGALMLVVVAFAMFSTVDVMMKFLSLRYPLTQTIFFQVFFATIPAAIAGYRQYGFREIREARLGIQAVRAAFSLAATLLGIFAFRRMPIADVYALSFSSPLFITLLSGPLLGEHVGWRRWLAVVVGFIGVLVMLRPGQGMADIGAVAAVASAFAYSAGMLMVRVAQHRAGYRAGGATFALFTMLINSAVMAATLPFVWVTPSLPHLALAILSGLVGGTATILVLNAYTKVAAATVAPFQYSMMVWGVFWGYVIFGDRPDRWLFIGGAIVIGSGLFILMRESRRGLPSELPTDPL